MKQAFVIVVCCLSVKYAEPYCQDSVDSVVFPCKTPDLNEGLCMSIRNCDAFINALETANEEEKQFMRNSKCGEWIGPKHPRVCCGFKPFFKPNIRIPDVEPQEDLLPNRAQCGYDADPDKIIGGDAAKITDFPWSALLNYGAKDEEPDYKGGGALINKRYVLTAAHCIIEGLRSVRLGEWDLENSPSCVSTKFRNFCNKPFEFEVESTVTHPKYDKPTYRHDIALIRLSDSVTFSDFVQPICLPLASESSKPGDMLWMAGWGVTNKLLTERSSIKQIAQLPIILWKNCRKIFKKKLRDWNICAGGINNKSTCTGDSGGPLTANINESRQYYVEGILSFGRWQTCAEDATVVFTRVSYYLDWIKRNVKP